MLWAKRREQTFRILSGQLGHLFGGDEPRRGHLAISAPDAAVKIRAEEHMGRAVRRFQVAQEGYRHEVFRRDAELLLRFADGCIFRGLPASI